MRTHKTRVQCANILSCLSVLTMTVEVPAMLPENNASCVLSAFTPPRVVIGCWQILERHPDESTAVETLKAYAHAGFTTFDTADIYGRSEAVLGRLRSSGGTPTIHIHTKFVTRESDARTARDVNRRSSEALGAAPDLVAFHWWDYTDKRFVKAAEHLSVLRGEGLLQHVAACNFDLPHLQALVDAGVPIVSNQVQYSLIDLRPENGMLSYCKARGIRLATFGTVAGGLLSDKWLGAPPPSREQLSTVSARMYFAPLSRWTGGNWELFQQLLRTMRSVADKHTTSIANVASAWVLRQLGPDGGWVILGVRDTQHLAEHVSLRELDDSDKLDDEDEAMLRAVLAKGQPPQGCIWSHERGLA